jgi:RNA polymerase sigma-70 factor (ECF subfamily)
MELNSNLSEKAKHDYELVKMAIDGDQKAFEELFKRYRDAIYFMLLKMVNNKIDAEDLTYEAFGKAFRNLRQYSPRFAFSTWLFKISSNNCIDFLRKKRNNTISLDGKDVDESERTVLMTLPADVLNPEQEYIKAQKAVLMRKEVAKLKERYRRLIELRYFKEYSYEEIANELDLPLGTVKAQLFRARELLYKLLKKSEIKIERANAS